MMMIDPTSLAWTVVLLTSISITAYVFNLYIKIQHIFKSRHQCSESKVSVRELYVYPIKSCAEIQVNSAKVTPIGFEHDRIMQVVSRVEMKESPTEPDLGVCTPREMKNEKLFHVQPTLIIDESSNTTALELSSKYVEKSFRLKLN